MIYKNYSRGITSKRAATNGGIHLRGLALGQNYPKKRHKDDDTVSDLVGPGIEHQTSRPDSDDINHYSRAVIPKLF